MQMKPEGCNLNAASHGKMDTQDLQPDAQGFERASALLRAGELVAFPTETVYGLGADARNDQAVAKIYTVKGRPSFNPLIVHFAGPFSEIERFATLPPAARNLLLRGWPPGLTLVLPLKPGTDLSPLVTAGLDTVAIRIPASPVAQNLLRRFGGPVAAPSANLSGRISPTTAEHVRAGLGGKIAGILDGGPTAQGLESTILGFPGPVVLREGSFTVPDSMPRQAGETEAPKAPGQLLSHYAPQGQVRLDATTARPGEWHLGFGDVAGDVSLSETGDLTEAAAKLFDRLHQADAMGVTHIAVAPIPETGLGRAINDRLRRAAAPRDHSA